MKTIRSNEFKKYGLVLDIDTKEIVEYLKNKAKMPENGNIYIPHEDEFYLLEEVKEIEKNILVNYLYKQDIVMDLIQNLIV